MYFFNFRVLPKAISWVVKRRYKIHLRVGCISFPYLILRDVIVSKNSFTIQIDEITVRSSLFSSDVVKLLAVVMKDVRVNKDRTTGPDVDDTTSLTHKLPLDFRNTKIPSIIITFVQV